MQVCGHLVKASLSSVQFSLVQLLSRVWLFVTPWIAARQASLSITNSRSSLRLTSIESVMPSSHLILCRPLLLLPPIPPSIRVFSNESTLCRRWPKYWSFSFSIIPSKEIPGLISFSSCLIPRVPLPNGTRMILIPNCIYILKSPLERSVKALSLALLWSVSSSPLESKLPPNKTPGTRRFNLHLTHDPI